MRRERLYLSDVIAAADAIAEFLGGCTKETFLADDFMRSAVLQKLAVIGESAARLTPELRVRYSEIPWVDIIDFRNRVVHAYFNLDWEIVWVTATEQVPELRRQILAIVDAEYPEPQ